MHDIPSTVSVQASVGSSNMEEYYICPLPRSSTRSTLFSLVPDTNDPVGEGHSQLAEEERCEVEGNRLVLVLNGVGLVLPENTQAFSEGPPPHDSNDALSLCAQDQVGRKASLLGLVGLLNIGKAV
ncbi:hypothetical protein EDB85DRAFT_2148293 [Lactarius pseudohatsudake]|nr:hypothetical protein EDB85DRAFT_2148293 [Lactarius pseudohatsudake]